MANVTFAKEPKPGQDFFPLTVHYQEKYYAAGKVPGGFFKREARPTEKETLTARLIDRPIRPLFVEGFKNEVLVMCTVLSHDLVNDPDIVAMIAASAALTISGAPFMGPIAGCRVGYEDGEYVLNPDRRRHAQAARKPRAASRPCRRRHQDAVMMVESEAYELTEAEMLGAVTFAHEQIQPVIDLIIALAEEPRRNPSTSSRRIIPSFTMREGRGRGQDPRRLCHHRQAGTHRRRGRGQDRDQGRAERRAA
jgi:polyribonucleotide nucleotidyltransferase